MDRIRNTETEQKEQGMTSEDRNSEAEQWEQVDDL
jgi:hypothetical protein